MSDKIFEIDMLLLKATYQKGHAISFLQTNPFIRSLMVLTSGTATQNEGIAAPSACI